MNVPFEFINTEDSNKLTIYSIKNKSNGNYSLIKLNNNMKMSIQNLSDDFYNLISNENINRLTQAQRELSFRYYKEHQINSYGKLSSLDPLKNSLSNEKNEPKKSSVDLLSEVKKFKTELCHSWELTGTCKYGINVSIYKIYLFFFIIIVCIRSRN